MGTKENQVFSLLLVEHIFPKKTTKQKTKQKRSVWVKPWLKTCMYTSAFKNIFAELIVNDKEEFRRYFRISTATYHYFFLAWQNNRDVLYYISLPAAAAADFVRYLTFTGTAPRCASFHYWRNAINTVTCSWFCKRLLEFSLMSLCKNSFSSSSNGRLTSSILKENRRNIGKCSVKKVFFCDMSPW